MKKFFFISASFFVIATILSFEILSSGGKSGYTNSPGENNCTSCHAGTLNSGPGSVQIKSDPSFENGYAPGTTYTMTVTVSNNQAPNNAKFGFALEALFEDGSNGGKLTVTDQDLTQIQTANINGNSRDNIIHTGKNNIGPNSQDFIFEWAAPDGDKAVTFYAVGNAANNNGGSYGDNIYASSVEVKPTTTSILANELTNDFLVYPNPSNGNFKLEINDLQDNNYNYVIVNTEGSIIRQSTINKRITLIDLKGYSKGNYFLKVFNENKSTTKAISMQ